MRQVAWAGRVGTAALGANLAPNKDDTKQESHFVTHFQLLQIHEIYARRQAPTIATSAARATMAMLPNTSTHTMNAAHP